MERKPKLNYLIDRQRRVIRTTAEDCVTFADVKDHQDRLLADPDFDVSFDPLIDATYATTFAVSAEEARELGMRRMFSRESRRAFVASEPHVFGLGRMMEIFRDDRGYAEVQVFYSMSEALTWLETKRKET